MKEYEWFRTADRRPTEAECGPNGRIIVWHDYNGAMVANTHQLDDNRFMRWWMPYPVAPKGADPVKLDELKGPGGHK